MPLDDAYIRAIIPELQKKGVDFEPGLSSDEVQRIEKEFGFRFPPDLGQLLQIALPVSQDFPNWRSGTRKRPIFEWRGFEAVLVGHEEVPISKRFEWPYEGTCFDIENNGFWMEAWGAKPEQLSRAFQIAKEQVANAPRLIPVFGHRYIPDEPFEAGNPVFSVWQTDIIFYGNDLADYLVREFEVTKPDWAASKPKRIKFWSKMAGL